MLVVVLLGCTSWIDQKPACSFDAYTWSNDLLAHILAGEGDGSFDYDPEDTPRDRVHGSYKARKGDFSWEEGYTSKYWIQAASIEGYGTAYHDGDLDILYTKEWTDILGQERATGERVFRQGCNMVVQTVDIESGEVFFEKNGSYDSDDSFHWSAEIEGYRFEGGFRRNLSSTWNQDAENGSYSESYALSPKGTGQGERIEECVEGCECVALYTDRFDGGRETTIDVTCDGDHYADIVADYAYDGTGTEVQTYSDGTSCELTTNEEGTCRYACTDGREGRC